MKLKKRIYKVSKERAIEIAMNLNCISREIAETYTNSELKECLALASGNTFTFKADF